MNRNVVIVLAGGFLIAILVAVMVQAMIGGKKEVNTSVVQILVAAKDLSVGKELKKGDMKWQQWPEETMFMGAIMRDGNQLTTEAISGKLLRSLSQGQPVHMNLVVEDDAGDFLSANVTKGMRAVSLSVQSSVLADRLFRPGDFVDIMMTYRVRVNTKKIPEAKGLVNRYATETVMENVRILAIDKNDTKAVDEEEDGSTKKKKKKKSKKRAIITLEVHPVNAEKLVLANKMGSLAFALRSIGDADNAKNDKKSTDVGISRVMTELAEMSGVDPKSKSTSVVKIYSGDRVSEVKTKKATEQGDNFVVDDNFNELDESDIGEAILRGLLGGEL